MSETTFDNKVKILHEIDTSQPEVGGLVDFIRYSNLSLPLATLIRLNYVIPQPDAKNIIDESFALLLDLLGADDDDYTSIDELITDYTSIVNGGIDE